MTAVTFDTLKFVKTLEASGMPAPQAEAVATAVRDSSDSADLVTRKDLQIELQKELAPIRSDIAVIRSEMTLLKWMIGVVIAGVLSLLVRTFIHP